MPGRMKATSTRRETGREALSGGWRRVTRQETGRDSAGRIGRDDRLMKMKYRRGKRK
jgi:hypothetical protein